MSDEYAIQSLNLTKRFGNFVAVDHVNFNVYKGQIFGFLGPNGSGKATTIRMLTGILLPTGGTAIVGGYDIRKNPEGVKKNIGYMSQRFSLYQDLTVNENLNFFAGVYQVPKKILLERKEYILHISDLTGRENELVSNLSAGWKQRLALGCAIIHEPSILFLDEPTSGVDPISRRRFWDLIYDVTDRGATVLVTTHYMDEAEHCNCIAMIMDGKIAAYGSPKTLKETVMKGVIYEIQCDNLSHAMDIIANIPGVIEISLYGISLHTEVDNPDIVIPKIRDALSSSGIKISKIDRIPPTLEDVFVSLIKTGSEAMSESEG